MATTTGLKEFAEGRRDVFMIDPQLIEIEAGFNGRDFAIGENQEHVQFLKASIIELGVKEPLTVRLKDGKPTLVGGECRLRAVLTAISEGHEIKRIPCQAEDRATTEQQRIVEQVTRNSGKGFLPIELSALVRRLVNFGWEHAEIAKKLGRSPSYVSHLLAVTEMPEEAQQMVRDGDVSATTAVHAMRTNGDGQGIEVLREAAANAKTSGKKKASGSAVKAVAAARSPTPKPTGRALPPSGVEKVVKFLNDVLTHKYDEDESGESLAQDSERLLNHVLGAIS